MTIISIVMGQMKFSGKKPKFRPNPEIFAEMQRQIEAEYEQNDQPMTYFDPNSSPFQDFVLENSDSLENVGTMISGDGKFVRQTPIQEKLVYQNICPHRTEIVSEFNDTRGRFDRMYEYKPSNFIEIHCKLLH